MASSPSLNHALFLSTISLFLLVQFPLPTTANLGLLGGICKNSAVVADYSLCMQVLETNPHAILSAKNLLELGTVIFRIADAKMTEADKHLKDLIKTNPKAISLEETCTFSHLFGIEKDFVQGMKKDPKSTSYDTMVALDTARYCESGLAGLGLKVPSIEAGIRDIRTFSNILTAILDSLPMPN
ncbi:Plant invertase/pectin methylesterase inhibitor protein [Quillaja saponaria]|uniref:Plant invertase/pectin methylesterase inhibitor protein n=1 Tax=Quillaja saponaria TaxID=32244 RepID=A0AAD7M6X6_QUISA|nr:Plant invertase/pectin methylesterase inhibitor protein [Quillaja saponaria]